MRNSHFIGLCFALMLSSLSCKDEPTEPPKPPPPGKRDYTWTIDTLSYPGSFQTLMTDIWASSPKDVYVVGHNDQPGPGTMFHYNGATWKTTGFHVADGAEVRGALSLSAIYGFNANDIWAVGEKIGWDPVARTYSDTSLIIHYDGSNWKEAKLGQPKRYLTTVWGASPTDIWAGGGVGTLYHYDGIRWTKMPFDTTIAFASIFGFSSSDIYALCSRKVDWVSPEDSSQHLLYLYDGSIWQARDSFIIHPGYGGDPFGKTRLWGMSGVLYSAGMGIFTQRGSGWTSVLNTSFPFYGIYGSSLLNIFVVGYGKQVYHFNGTDWYKLPYFEPSTKQWCLKVWCTDMEVFIIAVDGRTTFMYHGK